MAKFPSQRKMTYQTGDMGVDSYAALASGGTTGQLNIPKDLSLLNRRGYASTTRKGVPLIYRCKFDFFMQNEDGQSFTTAGSGTGQVDPSVAAQQAAVGLLKIDGAQNNWVMRNAAVKWHAAREKMFRDAGVRRSSRGAYSHEIRYNYDANADTWLTPIDGDGNAFNGGEWEISQLAYEGDSEFELALIGHGDDEESNEFSGSVLSLPHSYLMSRQNQLLDTNPETSEGPAIHSVLHHMLSGDSGATSSIQDDVIEEARTSQDSPPYEVLDVSASGDTTHDITEPIELGRITVGGLSQISGSIIVDVPFGLCYPKTNVYSPGYDLSDSEPFEGLMQVEVLDIYEMQG